MESHLPPRPIDPEPCSCHGPCCARGEAGHGPHSRSDRPPKAEIAGLPPDPSTAASTTAGDPTTRPSQASAPAPTPAPALQPVAPPSPNVLLRARAFVPVPLAQLRAGDRALVHPDGLKCEACDLLNAMGLTDRCELRVCKVGEPCIVQVHETRVGISSRLAREIMVTKVTETPPAERPQ